MIDFDNQLISSDWTPLCVCVCVLLLFLLIVVVCFWLAVWLDRDGQLVGDEGGLVFFVKGFLSKVFDVAGGVDYCSSDQVEPYTDVR